MPQNRANRAPASTAQSFQIAPVLMLHTSDSCSVMVIGSVPSLIPAPLSYIMHTLGHFLSNKNYRFYTKFSKTESAFQHYSYLAV